MTSVSIDRNTEVPRVGHGEEEVSKARLEPTRVAVVGVGYWGKNYIRVLGELGDASLTMICDERAAALSVIGSQAPDAVLTPDFEDVLQSDEVDAIVLCTQASTHFDLARRALAAGKDVLVEKPLTTRSNDALSLVEYAREGDRILLVGHTFIYNPGIQAIRSYIDSYALGQIYYLYARRTNLGPVRSDVGVTWDLASHDVAIFNYLLDETPIWVSANGISVLGGTQSDAAFISIGYSSGIAGHIHVSWAEPNKVREVVVVGSDRRLAFDDLNTSERVRIFDKGVKVAPTDRIAGFGEIQLAIQDGAITSPLLPSREPLKSLAGHFLHCIRRGERPITPGPDGVAVVRTMEAIDRSISLGGTRVLLDDVSPSSFTSHEERTS
jgi:predicted dehydrogenase